MFGPPIGSGLSIEGSKSARTNARAAVVVDR
jgi:hypothetical protein